MPTSIKTILQMPTRPEAVRAAVSALARNEAWDRSLQRSAMSLLSITAAGVRTGGLDERSLASEISALLESALLRKSLSGLASMLCVDVQKYLIRHLNENTEGEPLAALKCTLAKAAACEAHVLSFAKPLLDALAAADEVAFPACHETLVQ
ncbi:hypothetical protein [Pseudomonas aeruginosa]|uniref:hypothetical protein n=1 Tax=Pseudomonas aeruginosa TaxID=287 RepID=UPI0010480565|nr:hypothetical protein [Pseudomonas aeruginosa]MCO3748732.1 hypothetical protein [Pseudomonas aeruginosa]MCV6454891.1 hypothetical protein [Pseudomonas aeruginosa]HCF0591743.1 hypothetical protein [Pseudomonas aeruginosa]